MSASSRHAALALSSRRRRDPVVAEGPGEPVAGRAAHRRHLGARYGANVVLRDIDLHVMPGEIVAMLGANGAGKTTFLSTVMGLVTMTGGRIFYGSEDITRLAPESRVNGGIALCPEGRRIFARMTVDENLRLGAGFRPHSRVRGKPGLRTRPLPRARAAAAHARRGCSRVASSSSSPWPVRS